jgi:orotidine-5'-phosphate decarboxylase
MAPLEKLNKRMDKANSLLCVGLDSEITKLPKQFEKSSTPQFDFNKAIIDATHEYVCAYKPNMAFYEARGDQGIKELKMTMEYVQKNHPDIFTICDAKRADIGSTNEGYVSSIFDWFGFDAITLHPYLGKEALQPFLDRKDKVSIILCRTSNPGAGELQDLQVEGEPLWKKVAQKVSTQWNTNENCMLVVGATYPEEMKEIRSVTGDITFLVPGIGAQGGDVEKVVKAGKNSQGKGMIINSARGIIFASSGDDFIQAAAGSAATLNSEINRYR